MTTTKESLKVKTEECRFSYVKLARPGSPKNNPDVKIYEVTGIFDFKGSGDDWKKDPKFAGLLRIANAACVKKFGKSLKDCAKSRNFNIPFRLGEEYDTDKNPAYKGMLIIPFRSYEVRPDCVVFNDEGGMDRPDDLSVIFSGCYGKVTCTAFGYENEGKGVSFSLGSVLKTRDGEHLSAHHDATEDFADEDGSEYQQDNSDLMGDDSDEEDNSPASLI